MAEILQRSFQFQSTAARVLQRFSDNLDRGLHRHLAAGFFHLLAIHNHEPRQQHRLRPFARRRQPALDEHHVQPQLSRLRGFLL